MSWSVRSKLEARLEFVRRLQAGAKMARLCREFEISRPTGYLWKRRYSEGGTVNSLYDRSHRPSHCPHKTEAELEELICELRGDYGWGGRKLSRILERKGLEVPVATINRIIKRNGLLVPEDCHAPAPRRFERDKPNELWQADFKGPMGRGEARCEPLSVIDDHSRFVVGLRAVRSKRGVDVKRAFREIFDEYGVPDSLLLDHGVPWWSTSHFLGFSSFSVWLMKQDLKLVFGGFYHPQTQGKVERFNLSLGCSVRTKGTPTTFAQWYPLLRKIRQEFNLIRPHESLGMDTPAEHYTPSSKPFNPTPRPVQYPSGSVVVRLDSLGRFRYRNLRFFVSAALAGEYVRLVDIESSLVVFYRNTPVREILRTGKSHVICPPGSWHHKPFTGLL